MARKPNTPAPPPPRPSRPLTSARPQARAEDPRPRPPAPRASFAPRFPRDRASLEAPLIEPGFEGEEEHKRFPRAQVMVPFALTVAGEDGPRFSARLRSVNLSVSGAFLESTFFLPVGTELNATFQLDETGAAIEASAVIVRHEQPDPRSGEGRSGFAIRFLDFFGRTEVTLARLFVGARLHAFAEDYLRSERARSLSTELDRVVDALAAWELQKVITSQNLWEE